MEKAELYRQVEKLYVELSLFDAVGLVGHQIKEKVEAALQEGADSKTLPIEIASLLKLENAASKMIDEEELEPEQKVMFSVTFFKDLKDLRNLLHIQSQKEKAITEKEILEFLNEEFPTDVQTRQCYSETIKGLITNLIMGSGLNQFAVNDHSTLFLIAALMYGRAALKAAQDINREVKTEIEELRGFCKRYYGHE